jgi:hypothetical protein
MGSLADIVSGLIGGGAAAGVATGAAPAQKYSAPGIEKTGFEERSSRGEQQVFKQDPQQAQVPQQQQGVPVATSSANAPQQVEPVPQPTQAPTKINSYDAIYGSPATIQSAKQTQLEKAQNPSLMGDAFGEKSVAPVDIAKPFNQTQAMVEGAQANAALSRMEPQFKAMRVGASRANDPYFQKGGAGEQLLKERPGSKEEYSPYISENGRVLESLGRPVAGRGEIERLSDKDHVYTKAEIKSRKSNAELIPDINHRSTANRLDTSIKKGVDERLKKKGKK